MIPSSTVSGDATLVCPYDKTHVILAKSFNAHLNKCRQNYKGHNLVTCKINVLHRVPKPELAHHHAICPSRGLLDRERQMHAGGNILKGDVEGPAIVSHDSVMEEQEWDTSSTFYKTPALFNRKSPVQEKDDSRPPVAYPEQGLRPVRPVAREAMKNMTVFDISTKQAMGRGRGIMAQSATAPGMMGPKSNRPALGLGRGAAYSDQYAAAYPALGSERTEMRPKAGASGDKNYQGMVADNEFTPAESTSSAWDSSKYLADQDTQVGFDQERTMPNGLQRTQNSLTQQKEKESQEEMLKAQKRLHQQDMQKLENHHKQQLEALKQEYEKKKEELLNVQCLETQNLCEAHKEQLKNILNPANISNSVSHPLLPPGITQGATLTSLEEKAKLGEKLEEISLLELKLTVGHRLSKEEEEQLKLKDAIAKRLDSMK